MRLRWNGLFAPVRAFDRGAWAARSGLPYAVRRQRVFAPARPTGPLGPDGDGRAWPCLPVPALSRRVPQFELHAVTFDGLRGGMP
ncbi:MAG: hypothetical protein AMXMBFR47_43650 [Planctomycetota bacterium]